MGLCNLKHLDQTFENRKYKYEYYMEKLSKIEGIRFFAPKEYATVNYAYFPIVIENKYGITRDELYDQLHKENIYARKYFYPITADQACFRNKYRKNDLEVARDLSKKILILPFYEEIENANIDKIVEVIKANLTKADCK